ncbi:serine-rich adhesin for platelets-like [Argopecten irradians]|uniref:serine-rich adhesin for platelets-like n=1 Tax=Argopecten irradians TaxID=31199 RepID=UPI00371DA190
MKKKAFTLYDVFVTILSLITYVVDVGSDILLIVTFLLDGHQIWAALSMAFVALSTFLMQIFSFSWHAADKTLTWKTFVVHALFLAPAHRYFQAIRLGIRAKQTKSRQDLDAVFRVNNDICLLRLIECFVESAPQLILQLYIILRYQQFNWVLGLSTVLSLTSMAWSMTAYTDGLRLAYKDKYNRKWLSMLAHTTWQTAMISARVMAIVIFSTVYQAWIFLAMGIHWCIMTFWITLQNADFGETSCEKRLFNSVSGFIYTFCFLNLKDSRARWRILAYHAVMLGENSLLVLLWFQGRPDTVPVWMEISTIAIVFGGYVVGGVFMMIYYGCCHPTGPKPEQDKEEMAYWFRRFSPREKRPKEKIFEIPQVPPHVADWLNASLNLSLASKADRLDGSHDHSRLGQQDYSRSLGRSMDNQRNDNSPVVSYQRYREPSTASTIMESDGEYTPRESTKLSYISASSSRHLIDSSSNLSVDSTDRYRSFNRDRTSSSVTTDPQYNSSGLETPNKLFTISAINNLSGSYLTPKHTSHDSFYSSPEFKTKELSPLDAKKLWEESQGRIDKSVAQTITIVTHTDLDKRRSHSTITWRKNSDSSQNSLHGEYNETGVNHSEYKQTQSREADSRLGLTTLSQYNDMNHLQTPIKYCSESMDKQDRFKILNSSYNQEVSAGQSDQTDRVCSPSTSKFVRGEEEPYYQYNMSGTPLVAEQPTMFSPWSPSVEDNIPYIDESVVDEPIHGQDTAQVSTNNKEESVLSDWFADISSLHHTQPDRFWISGINDTSDGRDRSNYDLSTTADESSQMSANRDYTDSSVEPRSVSSYQESSQQLSGPLDSSVSLYQYKDSYQEELNEKSYTDNLRTKSSHMMSGYCGSKVNVSDVSDGDMSSRSLGSGVNRGLQSSGVDRGLQSSNNSYTDTSHIDSMNGSSQKDYRPNAISPILSKSATALEDSGYHRSKSTASSLSGGEFTENESVNRPNSEANYYTESPSSRDYSIGSRSAADYSVGSRSTGDNSMGSRSAADYSIDSRSAADYSVGSRSAAGYSVGSRSAGENSMGSRSAGDYSMGSKSARDYSVGSGSARGCSVGSQSTGDYSMGSRSPEDYSMGSRSSGDCMGSQSVGGYRYDSRSVNSNMNRSRPFDESLESKSCHDYTTDSRSNTDYSASDMSREEDIFTRTKSLSKMEVTENGSILGSSYMPGMDVTNEEYARQQSLQDDQIVPNSTDKSKISVNSTNMDYSGINKSTGNRRKSSTRPDSRSSRKRSSLFDASVDYENNSLSVTKVSPVSVHNMKKSPHRLGRNIDLFDVSSWRNSLDIDADEGFTGIKSLMHVPPVKVVNKPLPITNLTESPYKFRPRKPNLALTQLTESPYKFRSKPDEDVRRMRIPSDKENELYMHRNSGVSQRARRSLPTKPLYLVNAQNNYNDNQMRRKSDFQTPCYMYSSEGETEDMSGFSPSGNSAKDTSRQVLGALENTPGFSPIIVPEELHRVKSTDIATTVIKPVVSTPLSAHTRKGSFQQLATPENYCSTVEV